VPAQWPPQMLMECCLEVAVMPAPALTQIACLGNLVQAEYSELEKWLDLKVRACGKGTEGAPDTKQEHGSSSGRTVSTQRVRTDNAGSCFWHPGHVFAQIGC
jgi:hypothetical protein